MKNGRKYIISLVLALVLALVPHMAMEACAAESAMNGFELEVWGGACETCNKAASVESVSIISLEIDGSNLTLEYMYRRKEHNDCSGSGYNQKTINANNYSCEEYFRYTESSNRYTPNVTLTHSAGKHDISWTNVNKTHSGTCTLCKTTISGDCTGGKATCKNAGICTVCGDAYLPVDAVNGHNLKTAVYKADGEHQAECLTCSQTITQKCTDTGGPFAGTEATCEKGATCGYCRAEFTDPLGHDLVYTANNETIAQGCNNCSNNGSVVLRYKDTDTVCRYTGNAQYPITLSMGGNWLGDVPQESDITYENNINAGTDATAKLKVEDAEASVKFTIFPYEMTDPGVAVTFTPITGVYSGEKQEPDYTVKFMNTELVENVDFTAEWIGDLTSIGRNELEITSINPNFLGSRSNVFYITRRTPQYTAPAANTLTYNGEEQALVTNGETDVGEMTYSLEAEGAYTKDIPAATKAGSYTVWYRIDVEDDTYNDIGPTAVPVTIAKASPTVIEEPEGFTKLSYNGEVQTLIAAGKAENGTMYYRMGEEGEWSTDLPTGINAARYELYYKVVGDENYADTEPVEFHSRIKKLSMPFENEADVKAVEGLVYTGAPQNLLTEEAIYAYGTVKYTVHDASSGDPNTMPQLSESDTMPQAADAGVYQVRAWRDTDETAYPNYATGYSFYNVTIAKAMLTPAVSGTVTKVYDGTTAVPETNGLTLSFNGLQGSDSITPTVTYVYDNADVGQEKTITATVALPEAAANYELTATTATANVGTVEALDISTGSAEDLVCEIPELIWNGTEQTVTLTSITHSGLEVATYELSGNTATDVGKYAMTVTGTGNFTGSVQLPYEVKINEGLLDGVNPGNVTSEKRAQIDQVLDMAENANQEDLTDAQKTTLAELKETAEELDARIDAAADAAGTENITKAGAITADNAEIDDKQDLQAARADLEKALTDYATNYTAEEKQAINNEIGRIDDLLADIADAGKTVALVEDIPSNLQSGDAGDWEAVLEAKEAYEQLSDSEKKIVDNSTGGALAKSVAAVTDIDLIKISATKWYRGSKKDITITYDGPYGQFSHITVNGVTLDTGKYSVASGSTVITLKASYLEKLTTGKSYKVIAYYDFGDQEIASEAATFTTYKPATNAATGDMFQVGLWAGIGGISLVALIALMIVMKKKKN